MKRQVDSGLVISEEVVNYMSTIDIGQSGNRRLGNQGKVN